MKLTKEDCEKRAKYHKKRQKFYKKKAEEAEQKEKKIGFKYPNMR